MGGDITILHALGVETMDTFLPFLILGMRHGVVVRGAKSKICGGEAKVHALIQVSFVASRVLNLDFVLWAAC